MPEPDPQPPQPRSVSVARWLLMLVPSALMVALPILLTVCESLFGLERVLPYYTILFAALMFSIWLCFKLGALLDKWMNGDSGQISQAIRYGFVILFVNAFISFAGCAALATFP